MTFKHYALWRGSLCIVLAFLHTVLCKYCEDVKVYGPTGTIQSPEYPNKYPNNTNCQWRILSGPNSVLTISLQDLDIEPDEPSLCGFKNLPCCRHNWLALPTSGSGKMRKYCGQKPLMKSIILSKPDVTIKFHSSRIMSGGRGFWLKYKIVTEDFIPCKQTEFRCTDGECLPIQTRCDGVIQCKDQSDEYECEDLCRNIGKLPCFDGGCYDNKTQLCDGRRDCQNGRDEQLCPVSDTCELKCNKEDECYKHSEVCDGKPDCSDYTDEINCGYCGKGHALCNPNTRYCFNPSVELCDGRFNCPFGEDEVGCVPGCDESSIACSSGEGCYTPAQRCNSQTDCADESDEAHCPQELCGSMRDKRQCANGLCLQARLWCDGSNDCGDGSDEQDCLKTSVVTVAIMGSLLCGLLLVIAVGCTFRIYGQRFASTPSNYRLQLSQHLASRLRMSHSVSLPALIDDDYFRREPPPTYSVAVGECVPGCENTSNVVINSLSAQSFNQVLDFCARMPNSRSRRGRYIAIGRRQRFPRSRTQPELLPQQEAAIKAENVLDNSDSQCEASSSQSSPSRESITSSSYLSGSDDNTHLLSS